MNVKITLGVILMITLGTTAIATIPLLQSVQGQDGQSDANRQRDIEANKQKDLQNQLQQAPPAITGDNVYVAWWSNKTGNEEVIFRASTDAGKTFGDKINLSNTTDADSWRVEIDSDADNVAVTWWETNETSDVPVIRVSDDNGKTFGPLLKLATNGTLGGE